MGRTPRKKSSPKIHPFFFFIAVTIFAILAILALAIYRYGITTGSIIVIGILSLIIVTLILILKSYLKDTPAAAEVFDLIPCRLGLGKLERKRFVQFCRRCNSAYITLAVIAVVIFAISESLNVKFLEKIYDFLIPHIGLMPLVIISVLLILAIPIQATIYAKLKKESNHLRTISGILFSIGIILLASCILKTFF